MIDSLSNSNSNLRVSNRLTGVGRCPGIFLVNTLMDSSLRWKDEYNQYASHFATSCCCRELESIG